MGVGRGIARDALHERGSRAVSAQSIEFPELKGWTPESGFAIGATTRRRHEYFYIYLFLSWRLNCFCNMLQSRGKIACSKYLEKKLFV
jgi:hypothetical protein